MDTLIDLLRTRPLIALHLAAALTAIAIGLIVVLGRKGDIDHRRLGWTWVALMVLTAASSMFMRDYRIPNVAGYTPIHLLTVTVAVLMPIGIARARRGRVGAHRRTMLGLFYGACITAGSAALLPQRLLGTLVWKQWLGLLC